MNGVKGCATFSSKKTQRPKFIEMNYSFDAGCGVRRLSYKMWKYFLFFFHEKNTQSFISFLE